MTDPQAPVTQEAREVAAILFDRTSWQGWDSSRHGHSAAGQMIRDGECDASPFVTAIATACAEDVRKGREEAARLAEAKAAEFRALKRRVDHAILSATVLEDFAASIRQLGEEG